MESRQHQASNRSQCSQAPHQAPPPGRNTSRSTAHLQQRESSISPSGLIIHVGPLYPFSFPLCSHPSSTNTLAVLSHHHQTTADQHLHNRTQHQQLYSTASTPHQQWPEQTVAAVARATATASTSAASPSGWPTATHSQTASTQTHHHHQGLLLQFRLSALSTVSLPIASMLQCLLSRSLLLSHRPFRQRRSQRRERL